MIRNSKLKAKIKLYLVGINIALAISLVVMLTYWLGFIRPSQVEQATIIGQYCSYSMDDLPFIEGEITADYIGDIATDHKLAINEELVDKTNQDQLMKYTDQLLKNDDQENVTPDSNNIKYNGKKYSGNPRIAIIITNLGLNRKTTELALTLPPQCALGFLPYTQSLKPLLNQSKAKGHEIYIYLPLETSKALDNPGKYALLTNLAAEENSLRLNAILNSQVNYNGIYTSYKETFTDDPRASEILFDHLEDNNLIFVLGKGLKSENQTLMKNYNNVVFTNIILDAEPDRESIKKKLEELVIIAKKNGKALGYAQGFTLTIEMVKNWVELLTQQGVDLVPVSSFLKESI